MVCSFLIVCHLFKDWFYFGIFQTVGKEELDRGLLKLRYMNRATTCLFPFMIGTGMSVVWDAFFVLSLFISSKFCSNEIKLKLNFGLFILEILSLIQILLEWSFYYPMRYFLRKSHCVKSVRIRSYYSVGLVKKMKLFKSFGHIIQNIMLYIIWSQIFNKEYHNEAYFSIFQYLLMSRKLTTSVRNWFN